eukprot:265942-Amorphochlora_amoeboformis.AAC.2
MPDDHCVQIHQLYGRVVNSGCRGEAPELFFGESLGKADITDEESAHLIDVIRGLCTGLYYVNTKFLPEYQRFFRLYSLQETAFSHPSTHEYLSIFSIMKTFSSTRSALFPTMSLAVSSLAYLFTCLGAEKAGYRHMLSVDISMQDIQVKDYGTHSSQSSTCLKESILVTSYTRITPSAPR